MHNTLGRSHDRNRIFLGKALHHFPGRTCFLKCQSRCIFGTEENIYIRKNLLDALLRLFSGPKITTEVYIKGNQSSSRFETLDHLNRGLPHLWTQCQGDTTGMETPGRSICFFWNLINLQRIERTVGTVINDLRLSRISAILIIVNTNTGRWRIIIHEKIIADAVRTDLTFHKTSHIMGRQFRNNSCAKSQQGYTDCYV